MVELSDTVVRGSGDRGADQCADTVRQSADHAVRRGLHYGIGEVVGGIHALCLCLCELSLGREQVVLGRLEVELRHDVLGEEFLLAVVGQLCGGDAGLGGLDVGFSRAERSLVGNLVDDEEGLTLRHLLAFVHAELGDRTRNLRVDGDVLTAPDGCRIGGRNLSVGRGDGNHGILAGTHCHRCLLAGDGCHAAGREGCFHKCLFHNST